MLTLTSQLSQTWVTICLWRGRYQEMPHSAGRLASNPAGPEHAKKVSRSLYLPLLDNIVATFNAVIRLVPSDQSLIIDLGPDIKGSYYWLLHLIFARKYIPLLQRWAFRLWLKCNTCLIGSTYIIGCVFVCLFVCLFNHYDAMPISSFIWSYHSGLLISSYSLGKAYRSTTSNMFIFLTCK